MTEIIKNSVQEAAEELSKAQAAYEKNKSAKTLAAKRLAAQKLEAAKLGKSLLKTQDSRLKTPDR